MGPGESGTLMHQAAEPHRAATPLPELMAAVPASGPYLTEKQLAARWQVNAGSLANARGRGHHAVPFIRIMGRVRYPLAAVEAYERRLLITQVAA